MNMKLSRSVQFLIMSLILLSGASVWAATPHSKSPLQVSGGIAMPATSTAVLTNPAGMMGASTALVLQAAAPEVWDNGTYRGGLQTGGSSYGVAAGIQAGSVNSTTVSKAYYGVAVGTENFSLGLAGKTGISNSNGTVLNAGLLFGIGSTAHMGITARGIDDGINEWGAGIALGLASNFDLVFDAAANSDLRNLEMKPGIKVSSDQASLTMSYGTGDRQQFADGFSAGASFSFASSNVLEIQYNAGGDLSKYFAAFTLGF
jgi:hypothetical protein